MEKMEFKKFCEKEFIKYGFKKQKKTFYMVGNELLCGLEFQKSNYGPIYYINYFFCIGDYSESKLFPTYYDSDIDGRILVMSKVEDEEEDFTTDMSEYELYTEDEEEDLITAMIEYELYTEEELLPYFEKEFEEKILPPITQGKKYILDNLNKLYFLSLRQDEVMRKLKS